MPVVSADIEPLAIVFADDGLVPNNPMPFLVYQGAVAIDNAHPEKTIEGLFGGNARVRFGGDKGKVFEIKAGDVAILPAGTGHQCLSASDDFSVVGAYPPGQKMDLQRPTPENHAKALRTIPDRKSTRTDPVMGADGPLVRLWRRSRNS